MNGLICCGMPDLTKRLETKYLSFLQDIIIWFLHTFDKILYEISYVARKNGLNFLLSTEGISEIKSKYFGTFLYETISKGVVLSWSYFKKLYCFVCLDL